MIWRLRRKFVWIATASFLSVAAFVMLLLFLFTSLQTNKALDMRADIISKNDGRFPSFGEGRPDSSAPPIPDGFNRESPFTTRYFTVQFDVSGNTVLADMAFIASIGEAEALEFGARAMQKDDERGWIENYRYKIYETEKGVTAVFINGDDEIESNRRFLISALSVFILCGAGIVFLIVLISKRAVKPAAEAYEKQKQFITNASHELKTPLTLIRTNLDILEDEIGKSEWLSDVRDETVLLGELVNRMVALARMDEEGTHLDRKRFDLSSAVLETAAHFIALAKRQGKTLSISVPDGIEYDGEESGIRQTVSILLDNAVKYCDIGGEIRMTLSCPRRPVLTLENSFSEVGQTELSRLFDRFYRADSARTFGTGFGIGLSMARAITEKHGGSISAYNIENRAIGFKIKF